MSAWTAIAILLGVLASDPATTGTTMNQVQSDLPSVPSSPTTAESTTPSSGYGAKLTEEVAFYGSRAEPKAELAFP